MFDLSWSVCVHMCVFADLTPGISVSPFMSLTIFCFFMSFFISVLYYMHSMSLFTPVEVSWEAPGTIRISYVCLIPLRWPEQGSMLPLAISLSSLNTVSVLIKKRGLKPSLTFFIGWFSALLHNRGRGLNNFKAVFSQTFGSLLICLCWVFISCQVCRIHVCGWDMFFSSDLFPQEKKM